VYLAFPFSKASLTKYRNFNGLKKCFNTNDHIKFNFSLNVTYLGNYLPKTFSFKCSCGFFFIFLRGLGSFMSVVWHKNVPTSNSVPSLNVTLNAENIYSKQSVLGVYGDFLWAIYRVRCLWANQKGCPH
jgi:hypothetical protein